MDNFLLLLTALAALPATLFVILYPVLSPQWFQSDIGRGIITSSFGLASLLDLSLLAHWRGWLLPRSALALLLAVIAAGAWLKLWALIIVKIRVLNPLIGKENEESSALFESGRRGPSLRSRIPRWRSSRHRRSR